jgi:hypothetical protein
MAGEVAAPRQPTNTTATRQVAPSRLGGVDPNALQGALPTPSPTPATPMPPAMTAGRAPGVAAGMMALELPTSGASAQTVRQDRAPAGVAGSRQLARNDEARVARFRETFQQVGAQHGLAPAILAAIASRGSRGGSALDRNGCGDFGNGHGLMQVDRRDHRLEGGPFSKAALSAYNRGASRINNPATSDNGTTGRDYANDVIARAQYYHSRGF